MQIKTLATALAISSLWFGQSALAASSTPASFQVKGEGNADVSWKPEIGSQKPGLTDADKKVGALVLSNKGQVELASIVLASTTATGDGSVFVWQHDAGPSGNVKGQVCVNGTAGSGCTNGAGTGTLVNGVPYDDNGSRIGVGREVSLDVVVKSGERLVPGTYSTTFYVQGITP